MVLNLAIYQFAPILRLRPNLLWGGLISQGSHVGINSPVVACTAANAKGLHPIKTYKIRSAEGQDVTAPVLGGLIDFKCTVRRNSSAKNKVRPGVLS